MAAAVNGGGSVAVTSYYFSGMRAWQAVLCAVWLATAALAGPEAWLPVPLSVSLTSLTSLSL